ncbi:hypothetical protein BsWGS_03008 [Bradybaena similaris]
MVATGVSAPVSLKYFILISLQGFISAQVLTPPYFNLAHGRNITATATCGYGVPAPELYCRLTGTTTFGSSTEIIQGMSCDYCNPENPDQDHRPEYATDGTERWWQSPPLSRLGVELNQVNMTISLGQEFHVAYVFIKMANSPRPGVWVLERSLDFGRTYQPWQYFADTPSDCINFFNTTADQPLVTDNQIICTTEFSKIVPLSNGEIVVSLVNGRPSANNFTYADQLQEWTRATDIQLRLLRTKTLLGHLMAIARQDPTVTRRYYYSIKDISIGGRCVCNGHASSCDFRNPATSRLICICEHNTCGEMCEMCCPGFLQKKWRRALVDQPFVCEPCQCYGHTDKCVFDEEVARRRESIDIHGKYEGGGVCQDCGDNTMGINCEKCVPGFYRPQNVPKDAKDVCRPCECDLRVSTGECEEESGRCFCRPEYTGINCDRCSVGYYGYPVCIPCECNINGTEDGFCTVVSGVCPCKDNYAGHKCDQCAPGYYNFPECKSCECNPVGSPTTVCDYETGQCQCQGNFAGLGCGECADGYFGFPRCQYCSCDHAGTEKEVCDKQTGTCLCKPNYTTDRCDKCTPGFFNFPVCQECECADPGSTSRICAESGQCSCKSNYGGRNCERCNPGFYKYPDCGPCGCDLYGSLGHSCDQVTGQCRCRSNFVGVMCEKCGENFYNYPMCEVCNCNPDGAEEVPGYPLGGCGTVTSGRLCECKERVMGKICDECKPGFWNLDRNNHLGCEECECFKAGTLTGVNKCDLNTGQCVCKPNVGGQDCNRCLDGFYNLQESNAYGCDFCNCDRGGSLRMTCDKTTGQCVCKPRITGLRCDTPLTGHFFPNLHQYKFEIEDGVTPEGARIRYGYDERIFPEFSWRGYAILTKIQPEVILDVDIRLPSLYQVIYRYVNREDNQVKGSVTLSPETPTDIVQKGELAFVPSRDPKFTAVTSDSGHYFVLNPGKWTIHTVVPDNVFLDFFALVPQGYYEPSNLQVKVPNACQATGDPGPCVQDAYPDLEGYPTGQGKDGYVVVDGVRQKADLHPDIELTNNLGSSGLAHIKKGQKSFQIDLSVPKPDEYLITFSYHNPGKTSQNLDVQVVTMTGRSNNVITLDSCPFSSTCRQVLKNPDGTEAVFNITTGYATLFITAENYGDDVDVGIDSVYGIPRKEWHADYIMPRIVCIKVNGVCVPSTYGRPVGTVRIDFEHSPNEGFLSKELPPDIFDPAVGLVNLNDTFKLVEKTFCPTQGEAETDECETQEVLQAVPLELYGRVTKPGQYVFIVHYYMPAEPGLSIPVAVHVDGKVSSGVFSPHFCPSHVGCRGTITFDHSGGSTLRLTGPEVKAVFNSTQGGQIWLDYLLIVPADQFSKDYLDLAPIDKSEDFLSLCVDEGFQLRTDIEFCRQGVFTLTTTFNNGALDCNCNVDGSRNFNCDQFGGQCNCKENIIGRQCSACRPGYYGFPNCRPCNCPFGLCHEVTGECICPPRVEGDKCDRCEPEAYGYDALIGCQRCSCNYDGVLFGDLNCDQTTGQCNCKSGVGGRRCDTCLAGHHSFPHCQDCGCDTRGTVEQICDKVTARCLCKDNVEGRRCNICVEGTYSLSAENPKGCVQCFCFGHTTTCDSADLIWHRLNNMKGWTVTGTGNIQEAGSTIRLSTSQNVLDDANLYLIAPATYLGRKINSYGSKLQYTILFTLPRTGVESEGVILPDVILKGNNMTVVHYHNAQPHPSTPLNVSVPLFEYNFKHQATNTPVAKDQFMMILSNLEGLHVRASYSTAMGEVRLSDVYMETASAIISEETSTGELANSVETCQCPPNYGGLSCEDCKDGTTGPHCERCLVGHYGDPAAEGCRICSCPLPIPSNNFATTCSEHADGYISSCACIPGYAGPVCDICAPGYFGRPAQRGSYCEPCRCSGNINTSNPNSCDRVTGACLLCENYSSGPTCGECQDWYWGDALVRKDCQACTCDQCGSEQCDKDLGMCRCKANVEGQDCEKCRPNTWGYGFCDGCRECNCGRGSVSPQCDQLSGVCECQPGVEGEKCERCKPNHWNYGPGGCEECDCLYGGAVGCDPITGRCLCLPGVTGDKCDRCLPRWVLVPSTGCQECDYCVHLLIDDLDSLNADVLVISRQLGEVSIGVGAFNKLSYYNDSIKAFRPQIDNVSNLNTDDFKKLLDPVAEELVVQEKEVRSLYGKTDNIVFEANNLPNVVRNLTGSTAEVYKIVADLSRFAEETLRYIESVRQQLLNTSSIKNIDYFVAEGERITQGIATQNFAAQNESAYVHLALVEQVMEKVATLTVDVASSLNRTAELGALATDEISRLYDLQNASRFVVANAESAVNTIRKLKAVHLETLMRSLKTISSTAKESEDFIKVAAGLITDARKMLSDAEAAVQGIESESSRLESATPELETRVYEISNKLESLKDLANASQLHANELRTTAAELDDMYESTRGQSESAVGAGQAYKNILNAMQEAQNSSDKALKDIEVARNESVGINSNASISVAYSQDLLNQAEDLFAETQNALQSQLNEAVNMLIEVEGEDQVVREDLKAIENSMARLKETGTADKSNQIIEKAKNAATTVDQAIELSNPITNEMSSNQAKMNFILQNTPKASEDQRQAQDNFNSAVNSKPEVERLLNSLTVTADQLVDAGRTLEVSVASLKEKIARARDEANRIKVGLRFLGNSTVTLRNPPNLEDAGSYSKVSVFFKTTQPDALILYVGSNQNTHNPNTSRLKREVSEKELAKVRLARQLAEFETDFLALELRDGRVVFTFNLGSGPARVIGNTVVNDGKWHQAIAERIGKTGTLTVKSKEGDDVTEGTSQGTFTVLELSPLTTLFLVGGVPANVRIPRDLITKSFEGGLEDLKFDEENVGLWNFLQGGNNYVGEGQRDFLQDIFLEGMRFNGEGYVVLSRDGLRLKPDRTSVTMSFKTYAESGILFYIGDKDFFSVELVEGRVNFAYDLGGGLTQSRSQGTYNNGEWHKVYIDRDKRKSKFLIDDGIEEIDLNAVGNLNNLESSEDVFIGGIDSDRTLPGIIENVGFDGCMKDLQIGSLGTDPFDNKRAKGLVRGCTAKLARVVTFPSSGTGYIGIEPVSIGSMFDVTFKVKTMQSDALLMFVTDSSQTNTFAVVLSGGHIVVSEHLGSLSSQLLSKFNTYGDGKWHYISVMKMPNKLTMSIDDVQMTETQGVPGELLTDSQLYFGGVPATLTVQPGILSTTKSLDGCLGDITINKKFKNLANVRRDGSVSLAECSVDKAVKPTMPPDLSPDQCALPSVNSNFEHEEAVVSGVRFGSHPNSRQEYEKLPVGLRVRPVMASVTFKTPSPNGVIFYAADAKHVDYFGLHLLDGKVTFGFNCGSGSGMIASPKVYNDDQWHVVKFSRNGRDGTLEIDGERVGTFQSPGTTKSLNTVGAHCVGGLPEAETKKAVNNLGEGAVGFTGCLKDITFNMLPLTKPTKEFYVQKCSNTTESGAFFGRDGGYVTLFDKFRVGRELYIAMDIKPRSQEGVLVSVHGNGSDFVVLQLTDGAVVFTADNGAGPITIRYSPPAQNSLCDGQWHSIRAEKNKHILTLAVDNINVEPQQGKAEISAADTNDPLYIGGVADPESKGIIANGVFVGCIRNVRVNKAQHYIATGTGTGDVRLDACPPK